MQDDLTCKHLSFLSRRKSITYSISSHPGEPSGRTLGKRNVVSMTLILTLVAFFIPHQVAFITAYFILLWACSTSPLPIQTLASDEPVALRTISSTSAPLSSSAIPITSTFSASQRSTQNINQHLLLLQMFLLPLEVPVLVVWIRTLATAGYTAPFDGDHNVFMIVFWLLLVEMCSSGVEWRRSRWRYVIFPAPLQ